MKSKFFRFLALSVKNAIHNSHPDHISQRLAGTSDGVAVKYIYGQAVKQSQGALVDHFKIFIGHCARFPQDILSVFAGKQVGIPGHFSSATVALVW